MKVNQLRLGNIIENCKVSPAREQSVDINVLTEILDKPTDCYKPVPITERHLTKFKMSKQRHGSKTRYYSDEFYIITDGGRTPQYYIILNEELQFIIDYVHQLQNLHFVLTSEELKY